MEMDDYQKPKQGLQCCGSDMRQLSILSNFLFMFAAEFVVFVLFDPSDFKKKNDSARKYILGVGYVLLVGKVFNLVAAIGALLFTSWPVILNVVIMVALLIIFCLGTVIDAANHYSGYHVNVPAIVITAIIVTGLFIYPQIMFIREVAAGILKKEPNASEEDSPRFHRMLNEVN